MKFSKLYSNEEYIFPTIDFHSGFNVVFAEVRDPLLKEKDSHNLGKTFLIQVIDFTLLSSIDSNHPFKRSPGIFEDFVFYLEIETVDGNYVTVKRYVNGRSAIFIHAHGTRKANLLELEDSNWTYSRLSLENARKHLNDLLSLHVIEPYKYRKGLGYFLRSQNDYDDAFRIPSFQRGPDIHWKPFVALLLGFDYQSVQNKHGLDERVKKLGVALKLVEEKAGSQSEKFDEIRGLIEIRSLAIERARAELNGFSFQGLETTITRTSINDVETQISHLNEQRYKLSYELQEIERSLETNIQFDLNKVQQIFQEAQVAFTQSLVRSYDELLEFNQRILESRKERLRTLRGKLVAQQAEITSQLALLDIKRQESLSILREQETFQKYQALQKVLFEWEQELTQLKQQLMQLNQAENIELEIEERKQEAIEALNDVRRSIREANETYSIIRKTFSEYVERVLSVQALLSVSMNQAGNLEFKVRTLDDDSAERETSESEGTSYKKILATCLDLTLLSVYSNRHFYRFSYHDGIFEGLDNRIKVSLIELVRDVCNQHGVQHILTVIDSDLPRDERDHKLLFRKNEIIRYLHDRGKDGRLFRTRKF